MENSRWDVQIVERMLSIIEDSLKSRGICHIMLTGGRSAAQLYTTWVNSPVPPEQLTGIHFYFGDERCVAADDAESNYRLAMTKLFPNGCPLGCQVYRMEGDADDLELAAKNYAAILPEKLDLLLLSMGEDGHIASLFPNSTVLNEHERLVVPVVGPKPPFQRLTVTPPVIHNARVVMVMAIGQQKRAVYEAARTSLYDISKLPARIVSDRDCR